MSDEKITEKETVTEPADPDVITETETTETVTETPVKDEEDED